ncbi:uncharacterized protein LOC125823232 [Solanum verrucosum]|uniref:uncharacterized protein LOC125823232 n=1 Tax=Solanum verrucosum TaxID=315347 RepID=UPI0020D1D74C|nr:uncharacterized protein LOC125823232 [Solanum verrucosum]
MGNLAHSAGARASRLEVVEPWIIKSDILTALTPLRASIDTLTTRVETCESRLWATSEVTALKAEVTNLRKDVDYLKSTDFTSLLEAVDDIDAPATSDIPPTTTGDIPMEDVAAAASEAKTDEEQLGERDATVYNDLADLEDVMFEPARQTS